MQGRSIIRFIVGILFLVNAIPVFATEGSFWIAHSNGATRISTDDGNVMQHIPTPAAVIAVRTEAASGNVWLLADNTLYSYANDGELRMSVALPVDGSMLAHLLAVDEESGTVWVGDPLNLFRFNLDGEMQQAWAIENGFAWSIDQAEDGTVWLAGGDRVWRATAEEGLVDAFSDGTLSVFDIAVDAERNALWLAGSHGVALRNAVGAVLADFPEVADALYPYRITADRTGGAWVSGMDEALRISADDVVGETIAPFGAGTFLANQVVDETAGKVWFTAQNRLRRFDAAGNADSDLQLDGITSISGLDYYRDIIAPEIGFDFPLDGSVTNQPRPVIGLEYSDEGDGVDSDSLLIENENQAMAFTCQAGETAAECTPESDLAEGLQRLVARIADHAGNLATAALELVIDTTPPEIPDTGLIDIEFSDGNAIVTGQPGSVEAGANVTIRNQRTGETVSVIAAQDGSFSAQLGGQAGDVFEITVSDAAGNASEPVEVGGSEIVIPPDPADVAPPLSETAITPFHDAVSFIYAGTNPIQFDVEPEIIESRRVVVLRGKVMTRDGEPLPGAKVTVNNHPEYGYTVSRADGAYDLAVNGGGHVTVTVEKENFLPSQRTVKTPWQDYVIVDDMALVQLDENVTTIDLSAQTEMAIAQGSVVQDEDGQRQATILVPPSTSATMTLPDGTQQALSTINVRATEYTVGDNGPAAMPGDLPPTTAYTYAVELSVDEAIAAGASRVDFSQSLPFYVDNFLDFPVGEVVPLGWYDRERAVWVPADNGKIVEIIDIGGDGLAILDVDGSEAPASVEQLEELGITDDERRNLANLYSVGKSLWRVQIDHFTPWDCNWPYGPPEDAEPPPAEEPEGPDEGQPDTEDDDCEGGCIIEARRRNLGETIPITGTPYTLNYRSNRMPDYLADRTIDIPLSSENVPESLQSIELFIHVAGRKYKESFPPLPNQRIQFVWDGKDVYGRDVRGSVKASVTIGFTYELQYYAAIEDFDRSFARLFQIGGGGLSNMIGRRENPDLSFLVSKKYNFTLQASFPIQEEIGGWTLSSQHVYDAIGESLQMGNGTTIERNTLFDGLVKSVAGSAFAGHMGDGGPATWARLSYPSDLAIDSDGTMYIADTSNHSIRRVDRDGIITTVAGNGKIGSSGDGGPATEAQLYQPFGIKIGPDGALYIADMYNHRIRRVGADGIITTVAGNGQSGFSGDGGKATSAMLDTPRDIAFGPGGTLYVADAGNNRIRQVGSDGYIHTVSDWRGGAYGIAVDSDGAIYVAETNRHRIERISPQGEITTIAGNGQAGYAGDGGSATEATLQWPMGVDIDPTGSVIISDTYNHRIRRVGQDGIITTVAGIGVYGFSNDGTAALSTRFKYPYGTATGNDGTLYIADRQNHRIRQIRPSVLNNTNMGEFIIAASNGRFGHVLDSGNRHHRTVDLRTSQTLMSFDYDPNGHLHTITDVDGNTTIIERDMEGKPTAIVAPGEQRTQLTLNADGYLETVTRPDNSSYHMTYTGGGLLTSFTNPNNQTNNFVYDDAGALIRDIDAVEGGWTITKVSNESGYTVTLESGEGRSTEYGVEPLAIGGRRQTTLLPDGSLSTTEFRREDEIETTRADGTHILVRQAPDKRFGMQVPVQSHVTTLPSGLVSDVAASRNVILTHPDDPFSLSRQTDVVSVNGKATSTQFVVSTRTTTTTTPEGRQSIVQVDASGKPVLARNGNLSEIAYTYTPEGRVETVTIGEGADARTTTFSYYASGPSKGWLESITDAEGRAITYEYDLAGRVTKQVLPDLREIGYGYDANGNLTSITPPGRPAHEFTFTPVDLKDDYTPPDVLPGSDATDYAYNLDKQLELVTRPDGKAIDYVYGATTGKLDRIAVPSGNYDFTYKPDTGQLDTLTSPTGEQLSYSYDGFLTTDVTSGGTVNGTVSFGYNNDFRVESISVNGNAISFDYDDDGILTNAGDLVLVPDTANGLLDTTSLGIVATDNDINTFGELDLVTAAVSGADVYTVDYERDKLGRITRKTETVEGVTTVYDYTYDLAGRLDTVSENGILIKDYDYDSNGNRTHINGTLVGTYDDQDRLLTYGTTNYGYTANGELTAKHEGGVTTTFDYDVLGNLRSATLPGDVTIDYVIDGQNRRIGKKVNGVLTQGLLYQDQLNPVAELDGNGNVIARFVYAEKANVPSYMVKGGNTYRIISDHLGSPRLVIDTVTGDIAQRLDYDEWGNVTSDTNPGFQPFGFAGGIYDQHTGLVRFGARDYDPQTGRWTAKDPIGLSGGINLYAYVDNDPINAIDPTGLLSSANCSALKKLVEFDAQQDSPLGTLFSEDYNALSFSDNMLGLNADFQTIGGPVDADWMLRSAAGGLGRVPGLSHGIYGAGKMLWNAMNLRNPLSNLTQDGNLNAPSAARMWLTEGRPLSEIFAPALQECGCQ